MTGDFLSEIISGKSKISLFNSFYNKLETQEKYKTFLANCYSTIAVVFVKTDVGQHTTELK